jgi:hypothetical protein
MEVTKLFVRLRQSERRQSPMAAPNLRPRTNTNAALQKVIFDNNNVINCVALL